MELWSVSQKLLFTYTRGILSPPHTSRAPGFASQDHAQARDSNAAQGNTQDMEATLANLLRKECQGCSETRRPSRPASRIQSSGAIVTSQPWIQLTGGYARCQSVIYIYYTSIFLLHSTEIFITHSQVCNKNYKRVISSCLV